MHGIHAHLARVYVNFVTIKTPILQQPLNGSANAILLDLLHIIIYTGYQIS
jgi:hypothetical protein